MKDAYYFSHDSNAKDDPKCVLLIEQLGLEGYGIYWILIETLRDQPNFKYPVALVPALARRYNTTAEKMKTVINSYGLFIVDEFDFFSLSLIERMEELEIKRENARIAGKKSAKKRQLNSGSTGVQPVKESKVNEIKAKENILRGYTANEELIESAIAFIEMRKSIKKPMTDKALDMMLTKLNTLSSNDIEKIEILNQSTMNCWQGIFPLKQQPKSGQPRKTKTEQSLDEFERMCDYYDRGNSEKASQNGYSQLPSSNKY